MNIFQESENIGITASASSPEVLVKKLLDNLKRDFEIHINEGSYQKEDVFFLSLIHISEPTRHA